MKTLQASLAVLILCGLAFSAQAIFESSNNNDLPSNKNSYELNDICLLELQKHMNLEKHASLVYKQMAAYFDNDAVAKKGFAKLFSGQAKEEHEHFEKFLGYINLRGALVGDFNIKMPGKNTWASVGAAVEDAIELEHHVYNEIIRIHRISDKSCKDVHLMNFLESEFVEEQVSSISKLNKLKAILKSAGPGAGEYMVDRDISEGKLSLDTL